MKRHLELFFALAIIVIISFVAVTTIYETHLWYHKEEPETVSRHWSGHRTLEIAPMQPIREYDDSWMDGP